VLASQGEYVLVLARDLIFLGDVLGRLGHGIDTVAAFHQRVDEAPAERCVVDLGLARERRLGLGHDEGRPRHALDAAG
jgi:hypothetical protein